MSETGGDINWMWWVGIGVIFLTVNLIYAYFFRQPWVPPENARFVDANASVFITWPLNRSFSWGTTVWVTDKELHSGALDAPVPLTSIQSIRETKWYRRTEPVIELEYERESQRETIQLAVRDWQKLKSLLESEQRS